MYFTGMIIGLISFASIGLFHPIVIKGEYYFSSRIWPLFLISGIILLFLCALFENIIISSTLSVLGFTCLWSIGEIKEQEKRVEKGWFPKNPKKNI